MKKIIPIITMTVFLISCGKKSEEKQIKENKPKEKISKIIKITEKEKPQPKKPPEVIAERVTIGDALSNALNFAKKVDLNTSAEEGNVEYMTIADAKRILDNSKELKMSFVENIANKCKDFDVVNYFMTNLADRILAGQIKIHFKLFVPDEFPTVFKDFVSQNEETLNNNKLCAAGSILNQLAKTALDFKKYDYTIETIKKATKITNNEKISAEYYSYMAIAYNCLHDFDNEAKSQYGNFKYFYENREKYPKEFLEPNLETYLRTLCNAERFDDGIKLADQLLSEGYINNSSISLFELKSRSKQKTYRY